MGLKVEHENDLREFLIAKGFDPDVICNFLTEQLEVSRQTDAVARSAMSNLEFWERELKHSQIDNFITQLKL